MLVKMVPEVRPSWRRKQHGVQRRRCTVSGRTVSTAALRETVQRLRCTVSGTVSTAVQLKRCTVPLSYFFYGALLDM